MRSGIIGGALGYRLLRWLWDLTGHKDWCSGANHQGCSKVEALFGPGIWSRLRGKVVIDFGCGNGAEAIDVAQRGAKRVIGIDIRPKILEAARSEAAAAGVMDRCVFSTHTDERADVVLSIDSLEHYDDPEGALVLMRRLVNDDGRVLIAFGPPWFHPIGGHMFSVFPWAHLIFTESALIRWRSDLRSDGATRFSEVEGGLNGMTVKRARQLIEKSAFTIERFEPVPIRRVRRFSRWLPREFFTAVVLCELAPARVAGPRRDERAFVGSAAPGEPAITAGSQPND